jgi:integrase/recombinase XerD
MSQRIFRHVSLRAVELNGAASWRLIGPDGLPILAFEVFAKTLWRDPYHTRKNYCRWLAEFFDFLFEASLHIAPEIVGQVNREAICEILQSYDDYLVLGENSGRALVQSVSAVLPSPHVSHRSSSTMHAPVRRFLKLSEEIRQRMRELEERDLFKGADDQKLFTFVGQRRELTHYEQGALKANSMIAGLVAGGPKFIQYSVLPTFSCQITYDCERAFPFDRVRSTLDNLRTYRDQALYSFCAASGCRISEALQLLWEDIDFETRTVRLVEPLARNRCSSYQSLTTGQRDRLCWKGRTTAVTLLIDPFATWFFDALADYLRHEYIPHGRNEFVFQYAYGIDDAAPYFLASESSRNGVLRRAVTLAGVEHVRGPHSFRHMYGTYLVNYFPRLDGTYGLPMGVVQKLMGHKNIKDTEKYAHYDKDVLDAELGFANMLLYGDGTGLSVNELKRRALLSRLAQVEAELEKERARK